MHRGIGTVLVVLEVLRARPGELHRLVHGHRQLDRLQHVVLLDLATEAAAAEHGVHLDLGVCEVLEARYAAHRGGNEALALGGHPHLDEAGDAVGLGHRHGGVQHFHAGMREEGRFVGDVELAQLVVRGAGRLIGLEVGGRCRVLQGLCRRGKCRGVEK